MIICVLVFVAALWLATYSARHVKPIWVHQFITFVCLVSILISLICMVSFIIEL